MSITPYSDRWLDILNSATLGQTIYKYRDDPNALLRVALFVFLFNVAFLLIELRFAKLTAKYRIMKAQYEGRPSVTFYKDNQIRNIYAYSLTMAWIGMLIYFWFYGFRQNEVFYVFENRFKTGGYSPYDRLTYICLAVGTVGIYFAFERRNYLVCALCALPPFTVAFLSNQRPIVIPIFMCLFFSYLAVSKRKVWVSLIILLVVGAAGESVLIYIRQGTTTYGDSNFVSLLYPIKRDGSCECLFYVFSDEGLYGDVGTQGVGLKGMFKTGLMLGTLLGWNIKSIDVTGYIADTRNMTLGSLHPTLYGWLFVDMKWAGILFSIFMGCLIGLFDLWQTRAQRVLAFLLPGLSLYIAVAMRGSLQYAYERLLPITIVSIASYYLLCTDAHLRDGQ